MSKASDYNITPISRSPVGGGRGLLVVFLTRESAALVQAQGPSLFIIKSCDRLVTMCVCVSVYADISRSSQPILTREGLFFLDFAYLVGVNIVFLSKSIFLFFIAFKIFIFDFFNI